MRISEGLHSRISELSDLLRISKADIVRSALAIGLEVMYKEVAVSHEICSKKAGFSQGDLERIAELVYTDLS